MALAAVDHAILAEAHAAWPHLGGAGVAWVEAMRAAGLAAFQAEGLPHRRIEAWKYTDLRSRLAALPAARPFAGALLREGALADPFAGIDGHVAVFVNGMFRPDLSRLNDLPEGMVIASLGDWRNVPAWAEAIAAGVPATPLEGLNAALLQGGLVVRVAEGVVVERPLHIAHVTPGGQPHAMAAARHALVLEPGAALVLLESHAGAPDQAGAANIVTRVQLGAGARLAHRRIQREAETATHLARVTVALAERAAYDAMLLTRGAGLSRTEIEAVLTGEDASVAIRGATLIAGAQHADITTWLDHAGRGTRGQQMLRAVADGRARSVYQGRVTVREGAQQTDSTQSARALLLSEGAEANAKPELEIFADDVKCGHGATVGALDGDALFYLRSRGVPEREARALLVDAFVEDAFEALGEGALRAAFSAEALNWLEARA